MIPALEPNAPFVPPDPWLKSVAESKPTHLMTPGWAQRAVKSAAAVRAGAGTGKGTPPGAVTVDPSGALPPPQDATNIALSTKGSRNPRCSAIIGRGGLLRARRSRVANAGRRSGLRIRMARSLVECADHVERVQGFAQPTLWLAHAGRLLQG